MSQLSGHKYQRVKWSAPEQAQTEKIFYKIIVFSCDDNTSHNSSHFAEVYWQLLIVLTMYFFRQYFQPRHCSTWIKEEIYRPLLYLVWTAEKRH